MVWKSFPFNVVFNLQKRQKPRGDKSECKRKLIEHGDVMFYTWCVRIDQLKYSKCLATFRIICSISRSSSCWNTWRTFETWSCVEGEGSSPTSMSWRQNILLFGTQNKMIEGIITYAMFTTFDQQDKHKYQSEKQKLEMKCSNWISKISWYWL